MKVVMPVTALRLEMDLHSNRTWKQEIFLRVGHRGQNIVLRCPGLGALFPKSAWSNLNCVITAERSFSQTYLDLEREESLSTQLKPARAILLLLRKYWEDIGFQNEGMCEAVKTPISALTS